MTRYFLTEFKKYFAQNLKEIGVRPTISSMIYWNLYFSLTICAKLMLLQNLSIHKSNDLVMGENLVLPRKYRTACLRRTSPIFQLLWFDFLSMSSSAYETKTHEENKINVLHLIHCVNGYYLVHYNCALRIKWISFTYSIPSRKCTKIIFPLK